MNDNARNSQMSLTGPFRQVPDKKKDKEVEQNLSPGLTLTHTLTQMAQASIVVTKINYSHH